MTFHHRRRHHRRRHRPVDVNVQVHYSPQIRRRTSRYVVVDLDVTFISLYAGEQFIGRVDRFPRSLPRMQVRIYRDGSVDLTQALVLVEGRNGRFELAVQRRDTHRRSGYGAPRAIGVFDWGRGVVQPFQAHRPIEPRYYDSTFDLRPERLGILEDLIDRR